MSNIENVNTTAIIDDEEFSVAEKEAEIALNDADNGGFSYTHKFRKPFTYMGNTYTELRFDWDSLLGQHSLAIEAELQALGIYVVVPAISGPYIVRMAAKACTEKIGSDAFGFMPLFDYNKIRSSARSFLNASE